MRFLAILVFLVGATAWSDEKVPFDCSPQDILKNYNLKDAKQDIAEKNEIIYKYQDGSVALQLVCKNNLPQRIFIRRANSVIMKDLVYHDPLNGTIQVDEFSTRGKQRQLSYSHLYKQIGNSWIPFKATRSNGGKSGDELVSDSIFNLKTGEIEAQVFYNYEEFDILRISYKRFDGKIIGFSSVNESNKKARSYSITSSVDIFESRKPNDLKIMVMDSGFDLNHAAIFPYLKAPFLGVNAEFPTKLPFEELSDLSDHYPPFSHGTMTSSISLKGLDNAELIPISGDPRHYDMDKIRKIMAEYPVDYVNISFYLPSESMGDGARRRNDNSKSKSKPSSRAQEIGDLITLTPRTLWVIAAANGPMNMGFGVDMDIPSSKMYPASFENPNILVVGAIESSEIAVEELSTYKMSEFSNYGEKTVDILAPGRSIVGAALGGGYESWTGTSFSAPLTLNLCAKINEINPSLTPLQVKQLVLLSAYLDLDRPFPVKSGGIIYSDRALYLAKMTKVFGGDVLSNPLIFNKELKALAVKAHRLIRPKLDSAVPNLESRLLDFWSQREI